MVRLKVNEVVNTNLIQGFQFHYGTIKRLRTQRHTSNVGQFQFHYGTIKSQPFHRVYYSVLKFQFHYGTIKSAGIDLIRRYFKHFNSTMVRLKDYRASALLSRLAFQFHYGTIKSIFRRFFQRNFVISIPLWYD